MQSSLLTGMKHVSNKNQPLICNKLSPAWRRSLPNPSKPMSLESKKTFKKSQREFRLFQTSRKKPLKPFKLQLIQIIRTIFNKIWSKYQAQNKTQKTLFNQLQLRITSIIACKNFSRQSTIRTLRKLTKQIKFKTEDRILQQLNDLHSQRHKNVNINRFRDFDIEIISTLFIKNFQIQFDLYQQIPWIQTLFYIILQHQKKVHNSLKQYKKMGIELSKTQSWALYKSLPLPLDQEGFVTSFNIDSCKPKQVKQFYENFGVVVFSNILTEDQIQKSIDDLWAQTQSYYNTETFKINRNDPNTWNFDGYQKSFGFVGYGPLCQPQIWKNRANPKIYKVFKSMYEVTSGKILKEPLIACFDRGSMMRPSKLNPTWQTGDIYHFDIDPWYWCGIEKDTMYAKFNWDYKKFNDFGMMMGEGNYMPNVGYTKLAGVLALSDTNEDSGGFEAALGFQNYLKKWCEVTEYGTHITQDKKLLQTFQKVKMRKGSLMIFTRELPHNIYPNKSQKFRYAQYLRMTPESTLCLTNEEKEKRKQLIHPLIPQNLEKTPIVRQILMLDDTKNS